jgi:hypothetical protein
MTNEQFIYWLKGFIDYQQLQEQKNPAFTRIKNELDKIDVKQSVSIGVLNTTEGNTSITYKTDVPITYTTTENVF